MTTSKTFLTMARLADRPHAIVSSVTSSDDLTCAGCLRPKFARHRRLSIVGILDGEKPHARHQLLSTLCGHPARSARGLPIKFRCFPPRTPHRHLNSFLLRRRENHAGSIASPQQHKVLAQIISFDVLPTVPLTNRALRM